MGVLRGRHRSNSRGRELSYAINVLHPYHLTEQLLAEELLEPRATIVNTASGGLYTMPQNLALLEPPADNFDGAGAYATQKRTLLMLADHWTNSGTGRNAYTMHPGWVATDGVRRSMPGFTSVMKSILRTPPMGADTAIWLLATRPKPVPGALWFDRKARPAHVYRQTRENLNSDAELLAKISADSEEDFSAAARA